MAGHFKVIINRVTGINFSTTGNSFVLFFKTALKVLVEFGKARHCLV